MAQATKPSLQTQPSHVVLILPSTFYTRQLLAWSLAEYLAAEGQECACVGCIKSLCRNHEEVSAMVIIRYAMSTGTHPLKIAHRDTSG